jgi:hypothetical protein
MTDDTPKNKAEKSSAPRSSFQMLSEPERMESRRDHPVRTAQTLLELYSSRQADDAMSVVNLTRPRRGHNM